MATNILIGITAGLAALAVMLVSFLLLVRRRRSALSGRVAELERQLAASRERSENEGRAGRQDEPAARVLLLLSSRSLSAADGLQ